jgi:hypothetical protein
MKGLKSSSAIFLGRPHWCSELRADDDDRAAGVVDALAEEVLAEAALLALEHVAERLQRALVGAGDGLAAAAVVEERVDGLLQHPLLVADDDLRGVELLQALEAVVAVDDAAVEVVEVGGREAAAVERDERAEVGRDHRDHLQHHPLGAVARLAEGLHDLQALGDLLPLGLAGGLRISARSSSARRDVQLASSSRMASPPIPPYRRRPYPNSSWSPPGTPPRRGSHPL